MVDTAIMPDTPVPDVLDALTDAQFDGLVRALAEIQVVLDAVAVQLVASVLTVARAA